jgi:hypothetical protein
MRFPPALLIIVLSLNPAVRSFGQEMADPSHRPAADATAPFEALADRALQNAKKPGAIKKFDYTDPAGIASGGIPLDLAQDNIPDYPSSVKHLPPDVQESYHAALKAHYDQDKWALQQRQRIFEWQYYAGIVVFFVSISVVVLGLYMSWLQFHSFHLRAKATAVRVDTTAAQPSHKKPHELAQEVSQEQIKNEIEISPTGAKVSTPVVGVIILTLSLAFFYLYLKFVFPIE